MVFFILTLIACSQEENYTVTVGPESKDKDSRTSLDSGNSDTEDTATQIEDPQTDTAQVDSDPEDTDSSRSTPSSDAPPNAQPDFTLEDINPSSQSFTQSISPRDYLNQVSGWYFIQST